MTEEQNKLAEEIGNCGFYADRDGTTFRIIPAKLSEQIIAALREPATDAVLNDVIDRLGEEYAGEDFAGDTDAWNMTVGHCIEVVRAALKGKGASQGVDEPHIMGAGCYAPEPSGGGGCGNQGGGPGRGVLPEPSGEFVRVPREPTSEMVRAAHKAVGSSFYDPNSIGVRNIYRAMLAASDEQKG